MSLDVRGVYDEAIAQLAPGQEPLSRVRGGDVATFLGGRPFLDVAPDEVLARLKVGLVEAGGIPTPLYGCMAIWASSAADQYETVGPPAGVTWRVYSVAGWINNNAGEPLSNETHIYLGVSGVDTPNTPIVSGAGVLQGHDPSLGRVPVIAYAAAGPVTFSGSFLLRSPQAIWAHWNEPAPRDFIVSIVYSEWPGATIPPR